jgi:hypothetical protein
MALWAIYPRVIGFFLPEAIRVFGTPVAPIFTAGQPLFAPDTNHLGSSGQVQLTARITAF